jgi:hypothetical protein
LAGGISAAAAPAIAPIGGIQGLVASAAVGGGASVAGGGKFENGAITAAYGYLFNSVKVRLGNRMIVEGADNEDWIVDVLAGGLTGAIRSLAVDAAEGGWAVISGMLRDAAAGKGNFGIGSAPLSDALKMGEAWVGPDATVASDGKTLVSKDLLRQFRPPTFKPNLGSTQANFEWRLQPSGQWQGNGHLNIIP